MKKIKNFYPLIGPEQVLEDWVVTLKDRPDLLFGTKDTDYISASPRPILYFEQLPLRWLKSNPGFLVFLRQPLETELPPWIIPPKISSIQAPPYFTFESTRSSLSPKRVLIINHHVTSLEKWENLESKYPGTDVRWINYSCQAPPWPEHKKIEHRQFCYHPDWAPDVIYDLNYGQGDTISPVHLHSLHSGARLEVKPQFDEHLTPTKVFKMWYGTWKVFDIS